MGMQDPMRTSHAHATVVEKKMDKVPWHLGEVSLYQLPLCVVPPGTFCEMRNAKGSHFALQRRERGNPKCERSALRTPTNARRRVRELNVRTPHFVRTPPESGGSPSPASAPAAAELDFHRPFSKILPRGGVSPLGSLSPKRKKRAGWSRSGGLKSTWQQQQH